MTIALIAPPPESGPLARYDAACRAVAEARTVDDVQTITAHADAMRAYAKQAKNRQLELDAAEIRIRAERKLGELMAAQRASVGVARPPGANQHEDRVKIKPEAPATLAEAGIDKNLAHRARTLAAVPEQDFEARLGEKRRQEDRRVVLAPRVDEEKLVADLAAMPREHRLTLRTFLEGAAAENGELLGLINSLRQELATLRQEKQSLWRQVQMWQGRARSAGWKEPTHG
jgi:hypothetical protein